MIPKRRKPGPQKLESSLERKKREIAEKEARNRAEMEKCQKLIEEAPLRAEEIARARREEMIARASRTERRRTAPASLPDPRRTLEANPAPPGPQRRLRAERRQGRLRFFLLLFILLGLAYWLYCTLAQS